MADGELTPILVVGAGVAGLTLACVLKRAGASVRIIDKLPEALPFARACQIRSRTLEIFQDLGMVDAVIAKGQKVVGENQFANGERVQHARNVELDSPYPFSIGIEQWKTEGGLESRFGELGGVVERQTELLALEERLDGVRATLRLADGSTEVADTPWLVGCDGAHSTVRHLNRQHFSGEADPRQYVCADLILDKRPANDEVCLYMTDEGMLGMVPLPEGRNYIVCDVAVHHDGRTEEPALTDVQALLDARGPSGATARDPRWLSWFRVHYRLTPHYRHGRTFLAGDAAHVQSPFAALGMNTSIQDAYNLGWKLALVSRGQAPQSLLDSYEKERHAIAEDMLALSKERAEHLTAFAALSEEARDRLYRHVHVSEAERLSGARHMQELDFDYRRSPICSEHIAHRGSGARFGGGPHAGSEARDAGPLQVNARRLTLFELIAGPRHTLLVFFGDDHSRRAEADATALAEEVVRVYGDLVQVCLVVSPDADGSALANSPATIVQDLESNLRDRYGAHAGGLYLVRPDGYIGWRSNRPSLTALRDHFTKVFTATSP